MAGIESPPLRVPAEVIRLPHSIHTVLSDGRMEIRRKLGSDVRNVGLGLGLFVDSFYRRSRHSPLLGVLACYGPSTTPLIRAPRLCVFP